MIRITKSLFRTLNKGTAKRLVPLLFLLPMLFFSLATNAQKTWNFGNDTTNWPIAAAYSTTTTVDGLTVGVGASTTFGQITANSATFSDGFTATNRFNTGGSSTVASNLPSKRYLSFPVTGPCTVSVWIGATGTGRTTSVSNGTTILGSLASAGAASPYPQILSVNYTGGAGTIYVYADNSVWYYKLSWTPSGSAAPTLTADTSANTVDNNLDIAFTDDSTWRAAVTAVKIGTTALTSGTDYVLTAGNLQLKPSAGNILRTSGSKSVSITTTGYAPATVTQVINAGAPTTNSTVSINPSLALNTTSTVTCTAKDQFSNLVSGYAFKFNVSRTDANAGIQESYTLNGVSYSANASAVATTGTDANGVTTLAVAIPASVNVNDGVSFQVTLADGTTNVGSAYSFTNALTPQTITFASLSPVNYALNGTFTLDATASSGLPVSYTSSNAAVATVSGTTVTIVGTGTTSITATQAGNTTYDVAPSVSRDLVINCGSSSNHDTTISACGSYTWANNGQTYTTSGTKIGSTTNCVTERLILTISGSTNTTNVTVCDPYTWANTGVTYSVSGIYEGTTTDCVLEKLNLTINAKNTYYVDADGDGYGAGAPVSLCSATAPTGYATTSTDCDDTNAAVWRTGTFYQDVDSDGYTDKSVSICYGDTTPTGYVTSASTPSKVWNFSDTTKWPLNATGIGVTDIVNDQLGLYPVTLSSTVNFGTVGASINTFPATTTTDAFTSANRFAQGGGGSTSTVAPYMPSQRYMYFDVSGSCRVLIWFKTGGSGTRTLFVTDGTSVINSLGSSNSADLLVLKANYSGAAKRLYIYGDQANSIYKIEVTGANITTPSIIAAPNLAFTADTTLNNVDNNIDITFTDNPTWRAAVTGVKIGTTLLTANTDFSITAGNLRLKPSGGNAALTVAGTDKKVTVLASGYSSSTTGVLQTITAGAGSTATSSATISAALAPNSVRTITLTAKDQYGNAIAGYAFNFLATVTNNGTSTSESYLIDGTAYTQTTASTAIKTVTNASGVATFTVTLPNLIDSGDGISIQAKLTDGTHIGNAFSYAKTLTPIVTVVDNCGNSVLSTNASGTLLWSTGETTSSITVNTPGTYTVTQTSNGDTSNSGSGVAAPIFTVAPTAKAQSICTSGTIANLVSSGTANQWYAAATGGNALASDVALANGTYYVSQTANGCESPRLAVLVTVVNGLVSQPINTNICKVIGGSAVLTVVSSNPDATYQWQAQAPAATLESTWANVANPVTGTAVYTGGTSSELSIRKSTLVLPMTLTKYRVKVTGTCGVETSNTVTLTDVALPTEIVGAITSNTATTTGFAPSTLAVGPYVGTTTLVSYRVNAFTGAGLTYYWTVPTGVSIVGQAEGVTAVTQVGTDANVLNVNFNNVPSGIGSVGSITVQAQNSNGCKTAAKSVTLTKILPLAPTTLVMTDPSLPLPLSGIATAVTSFAKYMGTSTPLKVTAAAGASSYVWELPAGVTLLSGATTTSGVTSGTSNVITVNFSGVTSSNTDNYSTTAAVPVSTNVLRIGVKSRNGVGVSTTANTTLVNPTSTSTAKLLTLTAVAPATPATLVLTNAASATPTTPVTNVSKFIGTTTEFTLTAAASALASSYSWDIPSGVSVVQGSNLTSNTIKVNFANVQTGTTALVFGVKAVNGMGSSVFVNIGANSSRTDKLLTLAATVPVAPTTLVLTNAASATPATAVTVVSKYIGTTTELTLTAAVSPLANSYSWDIPLGVNVVQGSDLTSNSIKVNLANVQAGTTALVFGVKAVNGMGSSVSVNIGATSSRTDKLLTVTAVLPAAVTAVSGSLSVCDRPEGFSYTITAPVGANSYVITAPVGSVVSSTNGVAGATPNILTTSDLTFKVVFNGTTPFPLTDKNIVIRSVNGVGQSLTAKSILLNKLASCSTLTTTTRLAVATVNEEFDFIAYPNPSSDVFRLEVQSSGKEKSTIEVQVYDMNGRLIEQRQVDYNSFELGSNYLSGVYNVIVNQGENTKTLRVIKK